MAINSNTSDLNTALSWKSSQVGFSPLTNTLKYFSLTLVFIFSVDSFLLAQKLELGDMAPSIEAYEWIQGSPVLAFESGKIYVVEMGATWCKPCAAAIPKLSALQQKYEDEVEVIGLFVQEVNFEPEDTPNPKYIDKVRKYVAKWADQMTYTVAVDDPQRTINRTWIEAMGRGNGVPQTFIINKEGVIVAHFKGLDEQTLDRTIASIIDDSFVLPGQNTNGTPPKDRGSEYDRFKPLYVNGNGGDGSNYEYRSIISKYEGGNRSPISSSYIRSWLSVNRDSSSAAFKRYHVLHGRVQEVGIALDRLYYMAYSDTLLNMAAKRYQITMEYPNYDSLPFLKNCYGNFWHKPVLEIKNTEPFETDYRSAENRWNYVLNVPEKEQATAAFLQALMQEDLHRCFGYEVSVEFRKMPVWYLKSKPEVTRLRTKTPGKKYRQFTVNESPNSTGDYIKYRFTNADIRDIIWKLSFEFNIGYHYSKWNTIEEPFIDKTKIDYLIDYDMTFDESKAFDNHDLEAIQKYLNRLGLHLQKGTKKMKVIVIKDPSDNS